MNSSRLERLKRELSEKPILPAALIAIVTLLVYSPVAHYGFLMYDDPRFVTWNSHVNTGLRLHNIVWAFTAIFEGNWVPVAWLSHMADCQLFGLHAGYHHLSNVLIHTANVILVFVLLWKATGACWRSWFVAALFALHPMNVDNVAWIAERKSLLCMFFTLLAMGAYGWYARHPGWRRYLAVMGIFALALMSKPMAVSLPLALLLFDSWPLNRYQGLAAAAKWRRLVIEKLPLFAMSAAASAVTLVAQRSAGALPQMSAVPLGFRLQNAVVSYAAYLRKMLWPTGVAIYHPLHALSMASVVTSALLLVAITVAVARLRQRRYLVVGWLFFVLTLIPVIGIVQIAAQAMADRYAYLPYLGLFLIAAWGWNDLARWRPAVARIAPLVALCVLCAFAVAAEHDLGYWQNGVKLFTRARELAGSPNQVIEEALADELLNAGQSDQALEHYRQACSLNPSMAYCHYEIAEILYQRRQFPEALEHFQLAAKLTSSKQMALISLNHSAEISLALGNPGLARANIAAALRLDPDNPTALAMSQWIESRGSPPVPAPVRP